MRLRFLEVGALFLCLGSNASAEPYRIVAAGGRPVPGIEGAVFDAQPGLPAINNAGQVAFASFYDIPEVVGTAGLWSERNGALALVAQGSEPAPGTSTTFKYFDPPIINDSGRVAFTGLLNSSYVSEKGIWTEGSTGQLAYVARLDDPAPGFVPEREYVAFPDYWHYWPLLNNAGNVAFRARVSSGEGVWTGATGGNLSLVASTQGTVPVSGQNLAFHSFSEVVLNNNGQVAFDARFLQSSGATNGNDDSIWRRHPNGSLEMVAREGDLAPNGLTVFGEPSYPALNDAGQISFQDLVVGGGPGGTNEWRIWRDHGTSGPALVAKSGDPAPGVEAGVNFASFWRSAINADGHLAFRGFLVGSANPWANHGIWSDAGGNSLELVVRGGDPTPDPTDVETFRTFEDPIINAAGQVAFKATLTPGTLESLWAQDRSGVLHEIVRVGDAIDVDDGPLTDIRYVTNVYFVGGTGNQDGRPIRFNDRGQIAFSVEFSDQTRAVLVSDLAAAVTGDYDGHGTVGPEDYFVWSEQFGTSNVRADGNSDGIVDAADYVVWRKKIENNSTTSSLNAVAEPQTSLLLLLGFVVSRCRRRSES